MKVAQVTATFPPYWAGTGNVVWQSARVLAERGHAVTVFTPNPRRLEGLTEAWPFRTRRLQAPVMVGNAAWTPSLARELDGFDVVHLHYPYIGGAEIVAKTTARIQVPLVLTYHNRLQSGGVLRRLAFRGYSRWIEPHVLDAADVVVAVHDDYRQAWFPDRKNVVAVPHGIDVTTFNPRDRSESRRELGLPGEERIVLFVGALDSAHRFKNVEGLLAAVARCSVRPTVLLAGDGDLVPGLKSLAHRLGIGACVHFLGARKPAELAPIYSAADVTVLPSTSTESFGLVLVESMACGTPVIATNLPGVRGVVGGPGQGGWVVEPGDVDSLAGALEHVLGLDANLRRQVGESGRVRVVREMTWERVGERLEAVYDGAVSSS